MEKETKFKVKMLLLFLVIIALAITIPITIFGDVIDKLEKACNEYNMNYEYREGTNCLDKNNVLHPISSDCRVFRWDEYPTIRRYRM